MTTIAYRDGIIAADSQVNGGCCIRGVAAKLSRSPAGSIAGACGKLGICQLFHRMVRDGEIDRWLEDGPATPLALDLKGTDFGAIYVTSSKRVVCIDENGWAVEVEAPFYADGSGTEYAMGAMAAGADAVNAVQIACQFDTHSGGHIQAERLARGEC